MAAILVSFRDFVRVSMGVRAVVLRVALVPVAVEGGFDSCLRLLGLG